jgi:EAL and modified HD-GYP domain-containing signal transduction protein
MFGIEVIQRWVQLLTAKVPFDKQNFLLPDKIVRVTLTRARLCEMLAKQLGKDKTEDFYAAGVLSSLNEFFEGTMEDILAGISKKDDIHHALIERDNMIKEVLVLVEAVEQAKWGEIHEICQKLNIRERCLFKLYAESISWTAKILQSEQDFFLEKNSLLLP